MEILYEHCFNRLRPDIKKQMVPVTTSLTGFSGETTWPLGQLKLLVTIGDAAIQAVPSTVHGMLKFPTEEGIVTIRSSLLIPAESSTSTSNTSYLSKIEPLTGINYTKWRDQVKLTLGVMDLDHALRIDPPAALTATSTSDQKHAYEYWEQSNRMSLVIIKNSISVAIRGAISDSENAKEYLSSVEEQFKRTLKSHASTLILKMLTTKYDEVNGVREHIMMMSDVANKLKGMDMEISEAEVENQLDRKIKVVRSDRRGGYYGRHTDVDQAPESVFGFCKDHGIINQYTMLELSKGYRFYCPSCSTIIFETRHLEFLENANNNGIGSFKRIELQEARDETPIIHAPISINTSLDTSNDHLIAQDHPNNVEENKPNPEINVEP
nr:UBN2_2 domain-containing protein [Tanacetum cinerariifolium]